MRRRHLLALVILALVVATVLAFGPVRVWDWMTTRTVTTYRNNGTRQERWRVRLWSGEVVGVSEAWYENGTLSSRQDPNDDIWEWHPDGTLFSFEPYRDGLSVELQSKADSELRIQEQTLYVNKRTERRTSPPWFTEEEILQSVEGVAE